MLELTPDLVPLTVIAVPDLETAQMLKALEAAGVEFAVHPPHRGFLEGSNYARDPAFGLHSVYIRSEDLDRAREAITGVVPRYLFDTEPEPTPIPSDPTPDDIVPICVTAWNDGFELSHHLTQSGMASTVEPNDFEDVIPPPDQRTVLVVVRRKDVETATAEAKRWLGDRFLPYDPEMG